ncbi:MAG: response regulator [Candidatus Eremiobacteraeota bacterium]|nr:response regulator [Candidatus Eremiobacteraeota bacterium]
MSSMASPQILIIDDARMNHEIYARILRQIPEARTVSYESAQQALVWAATNDPDLVLVDFEMPGMNGHDFIKQFRMLRDKSMTPVVMITASKDASVRHTALDLGATDFLTKPADPVEFLARARNLLALRDGQKKLTDRAAWLTEEVRKATSELLDRERESIFQLLRIAEFRDKDTASHIIRMGHLAALLAEKLGDSPENVEMLRLAAPMHDIGKVATPDHILLKRGKLTPEEWVIMREHTTAGYELLAKSTSRLLQAGSEIAFTHHEKYDGSGYPRGLRGEKIPMWGRITALVDVFDALTSERPYKRAWTLTETLERIKMDRGSHFDPELVDKFMTIIPEINTIKARYSDARVA